MEAGKKYLEFNRQVKGQVDVWIYIPEWSGMRVVGRICT